MNDITNGAVCYQRLIHTKYILTIGRKQVARTLELRFEKSELVHLMGIQHLTDIERFYKNSDAFFDMAINDAYDWTKLFQSAYFSTIERRLKAIAHLDEFLEADNLVFRYLKSFHGYSRIDADILLLGSVRGTECYLFLKKDTNEPDLFHPCSFFPRTRVDFTANQTRWTLLKKERIEIDTGTSKVLLDRMKK